MNKIILKNKSTNFEALFLKAINPAHTILFAAGGGGNPERHLPLLNSLVENNCTVIAPYFERLASHIPTTEELLLRIDSMHAALDFIGKLNLPIVGIGHSIGATLLLALSGGQMWMRSGQPLSIASDERIKKLLLITPSIGFFQAPKALEGVRIPIEAWAGSLDKMTPPEQIESLKHGLSAPASFAFHVVEGAGHFSFMNTLPPNIVEPMKSRDEFLVKFAADICRSAR